MRGQRPSGGFFDPAGVEHRIREIESEAADPGFWKDLRRAESLLKEKARLEKDLEAWRAPIKEITDLEELLAMAEAEGAEEFGEEVAQAIERLEKLISDLEFSRMMSGEHDRASAIVEIHSGAGGTESQDWVAMLLRMYLRWAERHGYDTSIVDMLPGEEAGLKSVTFQVQGEYAYGYLKAESGVHRLVRISPFDANARRHTTFASVFVIPDIEDTIEVEVREEDLRIDTFRAGGAGGQHVNKTDSAVRITHLPTGIVVTCQNERSQHKNKATAMRILKARLYDLERRKRESEREKLEAQKKDIDFGSQIRSYVLHPYRLVKDLRTGHETGNAEAVLDGDLDGFIHAYLLHASAQKTASAGAPPI